MTNPGRNSPVAILVAILAMCAVGAVVLQRYDEINHKRQIDRNTEQIIEEFEDTGG